MSHADGGNASVHPPWPWTEVSRETALEQLDRVLASSHFRASKRCTLFLRYVVEHAGGQSVDPLKERTIGVEVFERSPHYDTNQDPVVRVAAGEVRKRLAQYYQEPGRETEPRITLPAGSYVPEFHPAPVAEPPAVAVTVPVTAVELAPPRRRAGRTIAAVALVSVASALAWIAVRSYRTALEDFWSPFLEYPAPVLVCLGQPKAYHFRTQTQAELDAWFAPSREGSTAPEGLRSVPLSEFVPSWDRYISVYDAEAFVRLSDMFARSGKPTRIRGAHTVSLADLRGRPVVLIGAYNNDWTLSLTRELRFYFDRDTAGAERIRDRQNPSQAWRVSRSWPYPRNPTDYALVTRVTHPLTEQKVMILAGITQFGTQAAGEFVTNPAYFEEALKRAPGDWRDRNIQVVLEAKVMSGTVGPPTVLAVHTW